MPLPSIRYLPLFLVFLGNWVFQTFQQSLQFLQFLFFLLKFIHCSISYLRSQDSCCWTIDSRVVSAAQCFTSKPRQFKNNEMAKVKMPTYWISQSHNGNRCEVSTPSQQNHLVTMLLNFTVAYEKNYQDSKTPTFPKMPFLSSSLRAAKFVRRIRFKTFSCSNVPMHIQEVVANQVK